ncbi:type VI secretion system lipoprotein TssJ [Burkholderia stagnalis]|uniref:Type VI secretion system lipoprotein TssJ n=1 Tax=Burkholderia stagnalis TaxID=1503054 RepID=A0A6L3N275_9BURK|nr:type VI secretion system lipoprotein TssJ [Burkholderia stagnalis]KAB0640104.1 type VI secretion system lipoprotein TssJ [Burkholderia stagnalis]KVM75698.1 type VI secretion protein [Burkholderia stagnalis]KVM89777.1 type VI secretion protein [Burkholderia stagnalis]KVN58421.1 type VI secretion protein [Burkholderia stagnalis]KVO39945.1 type VI secretion protein [Burkholderia stagnalis]
MTIRFAVSSISAVMLLSACGAWQSVSDTTASAYRAVFFKQVKVLNVDLAARAALNPDDAGRATSVAVRVYQLKDRKMFDGTSYDDLLKNDRTVLAQDLLADISTVVNPGASASLAQPMQPETKYVAIVAFYRSPTRDDVWKRVIEKKRLDADKPLRLELVENEVLSSGDVPGLKGAR